MSGINKTNFLNTATIIEQTALPIETNVIWQAIWIPKINSAPQYTRNAWEVKSSKVASLVNMPTKRRGMIKINAHKTTEYTKLIVSSKRKLFFTRSRFFAP